MGLLIWSRVFLGSYWPSNSRTTIIPGLSRSYNNHSGIIEVTDAVVIGDEPATQHGSELTVVSEGVVSITLANGDDAHSLRSVIVAARDADLIRDHWVVSIPGIDGRALTFTDPATMPPPFNLDFARMQVDYLQRNCPVDTH